MSANVHIRVCRGRDCVKRRGSFDALLTSLNGYHKPESIKCQDICKGPVVLVRKKKHKFWFKRLRSEELLTDLRTFIEEGAMSSALVRVLAKKK